MFLIYNPVPLEGWPLVSFNFMRTPPLTSLEYKPIRLHLSY